MSEESIYFCFQTFENAASTKRPYLERRDELVTNVLISGLGTFALSECAKSLLFDCGLPTLGVDSAVGSVTLPTALNLLLALFQTASIRHVSPCENLQILLNF